MKITLNNNPDELSGNVITVAKMLEEKKYTFKMLIIKINGAIVKRDEYATALIHDGDIVDVIHLISGG